MREIEQHTRTHDKIEVVAKKQQEAQTVLQGTIKPKRGHKVWQIDINTLAVTEAAYKETVIEYALAAKGDMSKGRELVIVEGCIYIPALNAANALKKFTDNPNQAAYYKKEAVMKLGY